MAKKRRKREGQGALEYLIIIAAVLAIAAIVVLFLTGAFTGARAGGDVSVCKDAASKCGVELATSAATSCPSLCDVAACQGSGFADAVGTDCEGVISAVDACNKGLPQCVISGTAAGGAGAGDGGIEVFFMDSPGTIRSATMTVTEIEIIQAGGGAQTIFTGSRNTRLQESTIQRVIAKSIPEGEYQTLRIRIANRVMLTDHLGEEFEADATNTIMEVDINKEVAEGDILQVLIDIPLEDVVRAEQNALPDSLRYYFDAPAHPLANNGIGYGMLASDGVNTLSREDALGLMQRVGYPNMIQVGNARFEAVFTVPDEMGGIAERVHTRIRKVALIGLDGIEKDLFIRPIDVEISPDTTFVFVSEEITPGRYLQANIYFEDFATIIDFEGNSYPVESIGTGISTINFDEEVSSDQTLVAAFRLSLSEAVTATQDSSKPYQFGVPQMPSAVTGINQGRMGVFDAVVGPLDDEGQEEFIAIGPGFGNLGAIPGPGIGDI